MYSVVNFTASHFPPSAPGLASGFRLPCPLLPARGEEAEEQFLERDAEARTMTMPLVKDPRHSPCHCCPLISWVSGVSSKTTLPTAVSPGHLDAAKACLCPLCTRAHAVNMRWSLLSPLLFFSCSLIPQTRVSTLVKAQQGVTCSATNSCLEGCCSQYGRYYVFCFAISRPRPVPVLVSARP